MFTTYWVSKGFKLLSIRDVLRFSRPPTFFFMSGCFEKFGLLALFFNTFSFYFAVKGAVLLIDASGNDGLPF